MKHIFIPLLLSASIFAQDLFPVEAAADTSVDPVASPKEAALEKIFASMGAAEFPAAVEEAKKSGIHEQVILEARFLHYVDLRDDTALAALAPEFVKRRNTFDPDNSEVFSIKEDWLAVVHYTQSLEALQKGDQAEFKTHITEAFWLSPRQAQAFAPHINRLRQDQAMAAITLDPNRPLQPQDGGPGTTLGQLMKEKKATVLHFWSPMSQEVQLNLPDFIQTTKSCNEQNIAVISVLVGEYPTIKEDAELIRKEDAGEALCTWISDSNKGSLSNTLRIADIPTMVIVSPEGKILFNGHPSDKKFWSEIKMVAPEFKRPNNLKKDPEAE